MDNQLGDYLRARRSLLQPKDVGITERGRRRVAGLRREELAAIVGISPDYYTRIEQGRQSPSDQVITALSRALQLDSNAESYLRELARGPSKSSPLDDEPPLSPGMAELVASTQVPALVLGRYRDVLALNRTAGSLLPILQIGGNQLNALFLDPVARELYIDWEAVAATAVGALRAASPPRASDDRLDALVRNLSAQSPFFEQLWQRQDVMIAPPGTYVRIDHPRVGRINLRYEILSAVAHSGRMLVVYYTDDQPSRDALAALETLKA